MSLITNYTLSNGVKIPQVGFGTWQTPAGKIAQQAVKDALEIGYRHIDTAQVYQNEESVGEGIKASAVKRGDIFLTTKLWNDRRGYEETFKAFEESLEKLQTTYVDLLLIHWPNPLDYRDTWEEVNAETWKAMEKLYEDGKVKAIGVSNFMIHHLKALEKTAKIFPMVNQIFLAPGERQEELVHYCKEKKMVVEAYSPLGSGKIFEIKEMQDLAEKYQKTIAQIALRWSLQHEFLPLPKSVHKNRILENSEIFDFELSKEDMVILDAFDGIIGKQKDPDARPY